MPQQQPGQAILNIPSRIAAGYKSLTDAFGEDEEGNKKPKPVTPPGPTMVDEANKSFADNPANLSPEGQAAAKAKPSFMTKAMKKPAPAPAPSPTAAARNRYGSTQKKQNGGY